MPEHTHCIWMQEPPQKSFPAATEAPKVPQHTHSPARSSLLLQSQEQNMLAGRGVACKAAGVLCAIPHPGAPLRRKHPNFQDTLPAFQPREQVWR